MKKETAHIILFFGDIFAIWGFWLGYQEIHQIIVSISNAANSISFVNRNGVSFIAIMVPVVHIYAILEYFKPSIVAKRRDLINRTLIAFCIGLLGLSFFISTATRNYVENSGYLYCNDASGISALFKTVVYTKDWETCDQLGTEKRAKLGLPPRK